MKDREFDSYDAERPSLLDEFDMAISSLAKSIESLEGRLAGITSQVDKPGSTPSDISTPASRYSSRLAVAVERLCVQRQRIEELTLSVEV